MVEGSNDGVVVEGSDAVSVEGCDDVPVGDTDGVSCELVMILLLLAAVEVGDGMPVASPVQLLLVGPVHERNPWHNLVIS